MRWPVIRCCCPRPAQASTSSGISRTGATSSGLWWGHYDQDHLRPSEGQGRADRPGSLRPLGYERHRTLVLGDRQGPAVAGDGADRHRPDRRRSCLTRRRPALLGRQCPFLRALLFLAPARLDRVRRLSLFGAAFFFVLLIFVPIIGPEHNGAKRWIEFGLGQVQPSEFLKPFFVVAMAWLLSLRESDKSLPVYPISALVTGAIAFLLMKQPDFGSTIIFCAVWVAMLALAGVSLRMLGILAAGAVVGIVLAYFFYPVATTRIDGFLFGEGDNF